MLKTTTAIAAGLIALSTVAQAETVKENWNQPLGVENPGRVTSPDECMLDNSSAFACWNDRDLGEPSPVSPVEEEEEEEEQPNGNGPTTDTLIEL